MASLRGLKFIIPAIFAASAVMDYAFTIFFSGTKENLIQNEFSPLLVYAIRNDILELFYIASAIIFMISIAHAFGGLSWGLLKRIPPNKAVSDISI